MGLSLDSDEYSIRLLLIPLQIQDENAMNFKENINDMLYFDRRTLSCSEQTHNYTTLNNRMFAN